jgi:sulfite exporter TauE/SafE
MEFLHQILENSEYGFVTALILGLMTAISPCPLATNISAIGFISRDLGDSRRVFLSGLVYTAGRAVSYTGVALLIYFGASQMNISLIFQGWGEKVLGPLLILIGLLMLDVVTLRLPGFSNLTERIGEKGKGSYRGAFLLGLIFALAFCPYSGVLYFGMLIPVTIANAGGLYLPLVFAVATGLPVILFAWLLAYAVGNVATLYNRIKIFEKWFRRIVSILFIAIGLYYCYVFFI